MVGDRTLVIVLVGMPGVGKLTVARALAAKTGYAIFHNHLIVDALTPVFPIGTEAFSDLRDEFWLATMTRAAEECLSGVIFTFAPEPSVVPGFLDRLGDAIRSARGIPFFTELRCDEDEHDRRVVDPSRGQFGKMTDVVWVRDGLSAGNFAHDLAKPMNLTIDITARAPDEAAKIIGDSLQSI